MEISQKEICVVTGYSLAKVRKDIQRGVLVQGDLRSFIAYYMISLLERGLDVFEEALRDVSVGVLSGSDCVGGGAETDTEVSDEAGKADSWEALPDEGERIYEQDPEEHGVSSQFCSNASEDKKAGEVPAVDHGESAEGGAGDVGAEGLPEDDGAFDAFENKLLRKMMMRPRLLSRSVAEKCIMQGRDHLGVAHIGKGDLEELGW